MDDGQMGGWMDRSVEKERNRQVERVRDRWMDGWLAALAGRWLRG